MKHWKALWFLCSAAVLASCHAKIVHDERPCHELEVIDSLMWTQPDSAFAVLLAFAESPLADSLDEFNGHYFQLLVSELLFKNYYEQSNREDLLKAVNYFDSQTDAFLSARAHYMNGVGYYETDSVMPTCKEYMKSLEIMENGFDVKRLNGPKAQFMSLIYSRLGELFSDQCMIKPGIYCCEQALVFCRIQPTSPQGVANILYHLGILYDMLGEGEKAEAYYKQALNNLSEHDNPLYGGIIASKALCDYQLGADAEACLSAIRQVLPYMEKEGDLLGRYLKMGGIFFEERLFDSVLVYLEPVFEKKSDVETKVLAAEYLRVAYDSLGYKEKKDECVSFLAEHKKMGDEDKALVSLLEDLFKNHLNKKRERQVDTDRRAAALRTGLIGVCVVLALVGVVMLVGRRLHRTRQAALSGRLRQSNRQLRELKKRVGQQETLAATTEHAPSFVEEPICRLVLERVRQGGFKSKVDYTVYKDFALDKQQLLALRVAADWHYRQFTYRLKQSHPGLTKNDIDYCCLYLLGLSDADVAALMQRAYNTVVERKNKLKRLLGTENTLSTTLKAFAEGLTTI